MPGGRVAAEAALMKVDPVAYTRSRNFEDGSVTRLSPYIRHGVLTLAEVRDFALSRVRRQEDADKFVQELGWRDYWQRLYGVLGDGIWRDREPYKTGFAAGAYGTELPSALIEGATGLKCMDSFSTALRETGYLHNHARMWVAAYTVHWLRVRWQAGARWFLEHLLDGDPASNNLSWQWVASTFSHKPYFFNRENLERYTGGRYCRECPVRGSCPFEGPYEELELNLFRPVGQDTSAMVQIALRDERKPSVPMDSTKRPLVWVHTDGLNPKSDLLERFEDAAMCFVWDEEWLQTEKVSRKRVKFLEECLAEMPVGMEIKRGDVAAELLAAAKAAGAECVVALRTVDPRLLRAAEQIERTMPVVWVDAPRFVEERVYDLKRFSRYWQKAQGSAMRHPGADGHGNLKLF